MMGEYVLHTHGKLFGGIYDDRFLVKPTDSAKRLLPDAAYRLPCEGAKPMLTIVLEDKRRLTEVVTAMLPELPKPKGQKKA